MSAVCLTSYTASVLAMVGSTLVVNQMPIVASSLVASTLSPAPPITVPLPFDAPKACVNTNETLLEEITSLDWPPHQWHEDPLSFDTPIACVNTNKTLLEEITSLDWPPHQWHEDDTNNYSSQIENNSLADHHIFFIKRKGEWSGQKDWLTTITQLVQVASTETHAGVAMPLDTLLY